MSDLTSRELEILSAIENGASEESLRSQYRATDEELEKLRIIAETGTEEVEETPELDEIGGEEENTEETSVETPEEEPVELEEAEEPVQAEEPATE